jgi:hypothetical protein
MKLSANQLVSCSFLTPGFRRDDVRLRRSPVAVQSRRWLLFAVLAIGFFITALSNDVYNATSPPTLSWHVLLRKSYSIVAFAMVGAAYVWASGASLRRSALVIALYSGAIEIGQHFFSNPNEPRLWNAIDVACGAIGGALGKLILAIRVR